MHACAHRSVSAWCPSTGSVVDVAIGSGLAKPRLSRIELRALCTVTAENGDLAEAGRHLTVRHYVRGPWRQHWYPNENNQKPVLITPHHKGPAGVPAQGNERVTVWRR